jgi:hypothetical protein
MYIVYCQLWFLPHIWIILNIHCFLSIMMSITYMKYTKQTLFIVNYDVLHIEVIYWISKCALCCISLIIGNLIFKKFYSLWYLQVLVKLNVLNNIFYTSMFALNDVHYLFSISFSISLSVIFTQLEQFIPRHDPHPTDQFYQCFTQEHLFESQFDLQL